MRNRLHCVFILAAALALGLQRARVAAAAKERGTVPTE
jgi:hypothetical protein